MVGVATGSTVRIVDEAAARAALPPRRLFERAASLALGKVEAAFAAEARDGELSLGAKAGFCGAGSFGLKVRAGREGAYWTLAWANQGAPPVLVSADYLTYFRTAALLTLLPALAGARLDRVLVLGTGRLGTACQLTAAELWPEADVRLWSPSRRRSRVWDDVGRPDGRWWDPETEGEATFDLILTCTPSAEPLPLSGVTPRFVGVGGAVGGRSELPPDWVECAVELVSDDPQTAVRVCGDLRGRAAADVKAFRKAAAGIEDGPRIAFVCGNGAFDAGLALEAARAAEAAEA